MYQTITKETEMERRATPQCCKVCSIAVTLGPFPCLEPKRVGRLVFQGKANDWARVMYVMVDSKAHCLDPKCRVEPRSTVSCKASIGLHARSRLSLLVAGGGPSGEGDGVKVPGT